MNRIIRRLPGLSRSALHRIAMNCRELSVCRTQNPSKIRLNTSTLVNLSNNQCFKYSQRQFSVVVEKLDSLGDSITTAVVSSWSKEVGDKTKEDDVICVVETDKVTMEIRAKRSGVFVEALVAAGKEVGVGADLYKIDTSVSDLPPINAESTVAIPAPAAAPVAKERVVIDVPSMGDSITQGVLSKWAAKTGDSVAVDQVIAMIETDKVTVEVRSPFAGEIVETFSSESDEVIVGNPLFSIVPGAAQVPVAPSTATASVPQVVAAPTAKATAPPAISNPPTPSKETKKEKSSTLAGPPTTAATGIDRSETRVKVTRMRQRIAQRLKESQNTAAMLTTFQEVDMSNLIELRNKYKDQFEKTHGVKLGFMSAFVRASTAALKEIPAVNAVIDDATNEIVYRNYVDISVAVASPSGLVVPVLRNTEKMSFADVEKSIGYYGKKAKDGALALEDMTGGTFTISNGGVFGSLFGTPIINPPQSAILGMHATKLRPVVVTTGGQPKIEARPMMYLALTYDHRLIDGREAVTFLKSIANKIEDPSVLLLDL